VVFNQAQRLNEAFSAWYDGVVLAARKRWRHFDHFWRTKDRYGEVLGGRLSAAIAYYGFFAVFALAMVVYSVLINLVSARPSTVANVDTFLRQYFTTLNVDALKANSASLTWIGAIGLVLAGLGWVDAWRSSLRAVWRLDQHPGNFLVLRLVDLATLIIFGLMMALSLGATDLIARLFRAIAGPATGTIWYRLATASLIVAINLAISFGLLTLLPRVHLTWRRLAGPWVAIAGGLTALNELGKYAFSRTENNPAYAVVATSVGLLIYLYTFNQIVIWATAWAATAHNGKVFDLAWGKPREHETAENDTNGAAELRGPEEQ
jgi:membrane protein